MLYSDSLKLNPSSAIYLENYVNSSNLCFLIHEMAITTWLVRVRNNVCKALTKCLAYSSHSVNGIIITRRKCKWKWIRGEQDKRDEKKLYEGETKTELKILN